MKLFIFIVIIATALADPCSFSCPAAYQPACGSDGRTYTNECALRRAACKRKEVIMKLNRGPCWKPLCRREYPFILAPVCGSDGERYDNDWIMMNTACRQGKPITFVRSAFTEERSPRSPRSGSDCSKCELNCPKTHKPVCAQDGKTYLNICLMRYESCKARKPMMVIYEGACRT